MHGVGEAALEDVEPPVAARGEVLVAPVVAGICASDTHLLFDGVNARQLPVTMGHEAVAEVVALGDDLPAAGPYGAAPRVGDRVAVDPLVPCGTCRRCLAGRPNLCAAMTHLGLWGRDGVFAERATIPAVRTLVLSPCLPDDRAIFIEPLACAVEAVDAAAPRADETVAVVGCGPFGLLIVATARAAGAAAVVAIDPSPLRRELARAMGANDSRAPDAADRDAFDVVVEAAGAPGTFARALELAAPGGRVVAAGITGGEPWPADSNLVVGKALRVQGTVSHAWRFPAAVALLARIDPSPMLTGRAALDALGPALAASRAVESCKVLVDVTG